MFHLVATRGPNLIVDHSAIGKVMMALIVRSSASIANIGFFVVPETSNHFAHENHFQVSFLSPEDRCSNLETKLASSSKSFKSLMFAQETFVGHLNLRATCCRANYMWCTFFFRLLFMAVHLARW